MRNAGKQEETRRNSGVVFFLSSCLPHFASASKATPRPSPLAPRPSPLVLGGLAVELCGVLVLLIIVLAFITVMGHFLWVVLATVFGAIDNSARIGNRSAEPDPAVTECILCG